MERGWESRVRQSRGLREPPSDVVPVKWSLNTVTCSDKGRIPQTNC